MVGNLVHFGGQTNDELTGALVDTDGERHCESSGVRRRPRP